ncbi:MAG: hypothetical protein ACOYXB_17060 [Bacteroidota bacterium]
MKTIIQIAVFFLFLTGCEWFDVDYNTYTIENHTGYNLTIIAYDKFYYDLLNNPDSLQKIEPVRTDSFRIEPYGSYIIEKQIGEDNDSQGFFLTGGEDSVLVYFNMERVFRFVCINPEPTSCSDKRNILNYHEYASESYDSKRKGYDYVYYFSEDDYNNAEIIE